MGLHRFKMLSFYVIMLLCLSFSVEAEQTCQQCDNSICGLPDFEESDFNPCCEGFKCYEWEDEMGYSLCMDKDAKRIPLNGTCAGFRANCEEGLKCDRHEKICVVPAQLGEDCEESPCAKGLRCKKGTKKCVAPAKLGEDCSRESPCAKRLRCKKKTKKCVKKTKKKLKMES